MLSYMPLVTLEPGTTYQVRVVAKNGDGFEAAATWLEFHTPGVGRTILYSFHHVWSSLDMLKYNSFVFVHQFT